MIPVQSSFLLALIGVDLGLDVLAASVSLVLSARSRGSIRDVLGHRALAALLQAWYLVASSRSSFPPSYSAACGDATRVQLADDESVLHVLAADAFDHVAHGNRWPGSIRVERAVGEGLPDQSVHRCLLCRHRIASRAASTHAFIASASKVPSSCWPGKPFQPFSTHHACVDSSPRPTSGSRSQVSESSAVHALDEVDEEPLVPGESALQGLRFAVVLKESVVGEFQRSEDRQVDSFCREVVQGAGRRGGCSSWTCRVAWVPRRMRLAGPL